MPGSFSVHNENVRKQRCGSNSNLAKQIKRDGSDDLFQLLVLGARL